MTYYLFAGLILAGMLALEHYLQRWYVARQSRALKRHATREAIRQEQHLDRWSRGEMWPNHGRRWNR